MANRKATKTTIQNPTSNYPTETPTENSVNRYELIHIIERKTEKVAKLAEELAKKHKEYKDFEQTYLREQEELEWFKLEVQNNIHESTTATTPHTTLSAKEFEEKEHEMNRKFISAKGEVEVLRPETEGNDEVVLSEVLTSVETSVAGVDGGAIFEAVDENDVVVGQTPISLDDLF